MTDRNRIVTPGERIGTSEEFLPGEGTYEDSGGIFASVPGHLFVNDEDMTASVRTINPPVKLRKGDHVLAEAVGLYEGMVLTNLLAVDGNEREITGETSATIHISKIDRKFVSDIKQVFRLGDIVRAEVIQVDPSVQLVTNYPHLGVIKALCVECRTGLERKGGGLICPNCGNKETRKMADDYGNAHFRRNGE